MSTFLSTSAVGKGYLQVTRSFEVGQPYVGIVELQSGEIGDDIASYLMTSEQIPSVVALGVLANPSGIKASGGIIAQVLPGADEKTIRTLEERATAMPPVTTQIDGGATLDDLVAAIAGPLAVRHTREYALAFTCTCSRERVERARTHRSDLRILQNRLRAHARGSNGPHRASRSAELAAAIASTAVGRGA
jgi:molecular chaperone Hsp33